VKFQIIKHVKASLHVDIYVGLKELNLSKNKNNNNNLNKAAKNSIYFLAWQQGANTPLL